MASAASTQRMGDTVNVAGRFCSHTCRIEMRFIALVTVSKPLSGNEIAGMLALLPVQQLGIDFANVVGFSHDSVAANVKAMHTLSTTLATSDDLPCISPTLTRGWALGVHARVQHHDGKAALAYIERRGGQCQVVLSRCTLEKMPTRCSI